LARAALDILSQGGLISVQVLNEFTQVARRTRQRSWPDIEAAVAVIRLHFQDIVAITADTHAAAVALAPASFRDTQARQFCCSNPTSLSIFTGFET